MGLNRNQLNAYGEYFFSLENKKYINTQIQSVVYRYSEVVVGPQNLDMITDYMTQIYQIYGTFEFDTPKQNNDLIKILTNKVIKACSDNIIQNLTMQRKVAKKRDRNTIRKKATLPQLQEKKGPLILNGSMPIDNNFIPLK